MCRTTNLGDEQSVGLVELRVVGCTREQLPYLAAQVSGDTLEGGRRDRMLTKGVCRSIFLWQGPNV